jgi:hypothetical protein
MRPLACEHPAGGGPKGRPLLTQRRWLATEEAWGLDDSQACSWVSQLQKPVGGMWPEGRQRIAGQMLGSSAPSGGVNACWKPGSRWQSRGTGGGSRGHVRAKARMGSRDLSAEDAPSSRKLPNDVRQWKRVLAVRSSVGLPAAARIATGGVWSHLSGLADSRQSCRGSTPRPLGVSARATQVAAAGRRGVNHATTQGRRHQKRCSGIVEDGPVSLLTLRRRHGDRAAPDGPGDVSRWLGSWDPNGCS